MGPNLVALGGAAIRFGSLLLLLSLQSGHAQLRAANAPSLARLELTYARKISCDLSGAYSEAGKALLREGYKTCRLYILPGTPPRAAAVLEGQQYPPPVTVADYRETREIIVIGKPTDDPRARFMFDKVYDILIGYSYDGLSGAVAHPCRVTERPVGESRPDDAPAQEQAPRILPEEGAP